jgi:hypothetical protein
MRVNYVWQKKGIVITSLIKQIMASLSKKGKYYENRLYQYSVKKLESHQYKFVLIIIKKYDIELSEKTI